MRVVLDQQIFLLQRRGGITRYVVGLINALRADPELGFSPHLPYRWVSRSAAAALRQQGLHGVDSAAARRLLLPLAARRARSGHPAAQLLHHTFYDPRFLDLRTPVPRAVTVHDFIPEIYPDQVPAGVHLAKQEYLHRADVILANSESTRSDLRRLHPDITAPVVVTPLGVDDRFAAPGPDPMGGRPFLLHVGRRGGYKDFRVLVAALQQLTAPRPWLLAVGGGAFDDAERRLLREHGVVGATVQRELTDRGLAGAYQHALVVVVASRYEGFGLPVLEAMSAGAAVVAASSSSLPEVGGNAAEYFSPGDAGSLASVLDRVIGDEALRARMAERGRERAARFTWAQTASRTAAAYRLITG